MDIKDIKYPIYIISKGRWENPLTAKIFLNENIPFLIAVEPQEYGNYCKTIPEQYILKLDFSNLGLGSYPARNFCWEHSIKGGYKKHFLFDDNIYYFIKPIRGLRRVGSTTAKESLLVLQNFTDKYKNIAISGYNYDYFVTRRTKKPFTYNTHVYSGMLIKNSLPFRWRLKYNEDVDLCLMALNKGYNTILLNAFLIKKVSTVTKMKGGNQTELYKNNSFDKKVLKSKSLEAIWPQYVEVKMRFGRPHHYVNWKKHFRQPLERANNA